MGERLEARIDALEEQGLQKDERIKALEEESREKDEQFKAQDERIEAQEAVIQGLLRSLGATVETAEGQTRVLVKMDAAAVAASSNGGASAKTGPSQGRRRRSSLLSGGKPLPPLSTQVVPVKENDDEHGEGGGKRAAGGQAQSSAEDSDTHAISKSASISRRHSSKARAKGDDALAISKSTSISRLHSSKVQAEGDDAPAMIIRKMTSIQFFTSHMLGLQGFLMCVSFLPVIAFHGIGSLWLDYAPSHLMGWAHAPIFFISIITHLLVTVELSEQPGWLEEVHFLGIMGLYTCIMSPYYLRQGYGWVGLGWAVYCVVSYVIVRIAFIRIRNAARAHHLREGTLGQLVDDTFMNYLEFMVVIAYGFLSSVSCLASAEIEDSTDLLDGEMWSECGPVTMANFCFGALFFAMFLLKLAIFETGIAEIYDMMTFNVPRGLKFVGVSVALMGMVTLYYQAATSFYMDLRVAFALFGAFMVNMSNAFAAVGLMLPLKAVAEGTRKKGLQRAGSRQALERAGSGSKSSITEVGTK